MSKMCTNWQAKLQNLGIWDTHKIAPSDSPCGCTKYKTSVWKRDCACKCVSMILPRDTGNAKCKLCAREAGQEMNKLNGCNIKPKIVHNPLSNELLTHVWDWLPPYLCPKSVKLEDTVSLVICKVTGTNNPQNGHPVPEDPVYAIRLAQSLRERCAYGH